MTKRDPPKGTPINVRDVRTKFFQAHTIIIREYGSVIGVYGIAVYAALCAHVGHDTQHAWPSVATLAEMIGASERKVRYCLSELQRLGLIYIEAKFGDNGRQTSNDYVLLDPPALQTPPPPASGAEATASGAEVPLHQVQPNKNHDQQDPVNKEQEPAPESGAVPETQPEDFSDLWPDVSRETSGPDEPGITSTPAARDYLTLSAACAQRQAETPLGAWTIPVEAGGSDTAGDLMLAAWTETLGIDPEVLPSQMRARFRAKFAKIAASFETATPELCARVVAAVLDPRNIEFNWYTYTDPRTAKFERDWQAVMLRVLSGHEPTSTAAAPVTGLAALDAIT